MGVPTACCHEYHGSSSYGGSHGSGTALAILAHCGVCLYLWRWFPVCMGYGPMDLPLGNFQHARKRISCLTRCVYQLHVQRIDCLYHSNLDDMEHARNILHLWRVECLLWALCFHLDQGDEGHPAGNDPSLVHSWWCLFL